MFRLLCYTSVFAGFILISEFTLAEDLGINYNPPLKKYNHAINDASNVKSKTYKTSYKNVKTYQNVLPKDIAFAGGCLRFPDIPNGNLSCTSNSGCKAVCINGHRFPHGERELVIKCREKQWKIQGADYNRVPHCEPICLSECKNNGICIAPNQCDCPENFSGPQCQFENKPCLNPPPLTFNARRKCSSKSCTIKCLDRFVFPDGSSIANLICKHGNWEPTRSDWVTVPDCLPVCNPPCENGGICLSLDVCQCPKDFRGPQCQYRSNACTGEKLGFNGDYQCNTLNEHSYSCTLTCPSSMPFEFPPAASYVCHYATGKFEPQPIPQCQPSKAVRLLRGKMPSSYYQHTENSSWQFQGSSNISSTSSFQVFKKNTLNMEFAGSRDLSDIDMEQSTVREMERVEKKAEAGSCFAWAGTHFKTFDGEVYSFESKCTYTLVKDNRDGLFTLTVQRDANCTESRGSRCPRTVRIFIQGKEYILTTGQNGFPEFRSRKKIFPIPTQLAHLRVEAVNGGQFLVASLDSVGLRVKWDGLNLVQLEAAESLWNRTAGLCGNMNGERDEFGESTSPVHLASSWRLDAIGEKCEEYPSHQPSCVANSEREKEASEFCSKLLSDNRYKSCAKLVDLAGFESACKWDYCSCEYSDPKRCACDTMGVYVRQCAHKGAVSFAGWRDKDVCPMECTNGKVYKSCGPRTQPSCGADRQESEETDSRNCEEGCYCPSDTVLHEGRCVKPDDCPCMLRGKSFEPGATIPKDCNTCACVKGKWVCTESKCSSRCSAIGDPHYTTFDGKRYDFMGKCTYYFVKADNYSVEVENSACTNTISEMMGFARTYQDGEPSCTKTVTIRMNDVAIKLKQNRQILVNGEDVTKLPMLAGGAKVRVVSSIFVGVNLPNGLEILWDGVSRVYVNAPAHFRGKTKGLCGTFSSNQKDDFLTPDGDVEQSVVAFANKWKTNEQCADVKKDTDHPCDLNPQKRAAADKYCSVLKKQLFLSCHWHVDPEPFYKDCTYDMCACESNIETCLCPTLAAYAKDCAQLGVIVPWRQEVKECRVHCPGDQEYQMCGNSCTRSCVDISFNTDCKEECVEGCNCPKGYTLDVNGDCIPIGQCPCNYGGLEFLAGYREVRQGIKRQELCTCAGGRWNCRPASPEEIRDYPGIANLKSVCSASKHLEVTTCEPAEPRTCRNMHQRVVQTPAICRPGCVCKPSYVLDAPSGQCVKENECPCYHGGQSYREGSRMQEECNTCTCNAGTWNCTDIVCPGVCSVWGDSHYKTFDDRQYDFQGACDYVLAKGKLSDVESFDVTIRNVACGTTGVTCSKSVTLTVGKVNDAKQESVTLTRGKSLTTDSFKAFERIAIRRAGLFIFLDVPDLGLVVQWDEGTRVYVRLESKWKGRTMGLCGDFNDDAKDDFKTPSGGVSEASADLFGDSWKMSELCATPLGDMQPDTCAKHPERRLWATQRCRMIKSELFEPCHGEVPPESYIERCVYDACGCDEGGDCECLCTAIAAYAHECNARGVPVQWRSQKLCPMQCDESSPIYSPCVSTCPRETCDNLVTLGDSMHLCNQDTCVEGCLPKACPDGQVYLNSSYSDCVPRAECKTLCKVINGVKYYEGQKVEGDDCHSCFCSRGKVVCNGEPCAETFTIALVQPTIPSTTVGEMREERKECVSGWTKWLNRDLPKGDGFRSDVEQIPTLIELLNIEGSAVCDRDKMVDIECRTVNTKVSYKEVDLNVQCNLEDGLFCEAPPKSKEQPCPDFEISILCRCEDAPSTPATFAINACDLNEPRRASADCHEFLECAPGLNGTVWLTKNCGSDTMFNEKLQICDWPYNVAVSRPECASVITSTEASIKKLRRLCKKDEYWSDCAIQCNKTCEYYNFILTDKFLCNKNTDCIPGCVPYARTDCLSNDYLWRDELTCVNRADCTCKSIKGEPMKPGNVEKVSECKYCQCINNFYTCDESECESNSVETIFKTNNTTKKEVYKTIIVQNTVTPPRHCESENYIWLVERSPLDVTLNASSYEADFLSPDSIRLRPISTMTTWSPANNDDQQWVEVRFKQPEPIYGVIVGGDRFNDKFVTSYKVLFSEDGQVFSYVTEPGSVEVPKVFNGPIDGIVPVMQIFHLPIEAKILRIQPLTWHKGIAMQVEIVGCDDIETTPATITTTTAVPTLTTPIITEKVIKPICDDRMGYDDHIMSDQQITVSSSIVSNVVPDFRLSSIGIWRPQLNNPDQFVQFDFMEPRNLTGVETRGGSDIWTIAYKVYYSNDGKNWNPVSEANGAPKEFLGNVNDYSAKVNYFEKPIGARFIRIFPTKWHRHIGLKAEIRGCFLPYPLPTKIISVTSPPPPSNCNVCNGIMAEDANKCNCDGSLWWDGRFCVTKQECPCVVGHITYLVGSSYETAHCEHCLCALGGNSICKEKSCEPCFEPGHRPVLTELCTCLCKPCPSGTRLCPTSNDCIEESRWCNGVQDCPDDERNCSAVAKTDVVKETIIKVECRTTCPPGFVMEFDNSQRATDSLNSYENFTFSYLKTESFKATFTKNIMRNKVPAPAKSIMSRSGFEESVCPKIICKPEVTKKDYKVNQCQKVTCPEGFQPKYDQTKSYKKTNVCDDTCIPIPPKERVCNNVGRTFTTFDNLEYKYDICNHILARDRDDNRWYIIVEKVCKSKNLSCFKTLIINFDDHVVILHPEMYTIIDGNVYNPSEVKHLGDKNPSMKVSRIGNALRFESKRYPFWVLLESSGIIKIGVSEELAGHVDGLCGFLDGLSANDQQTPEGRLAKSTQEFGDSWRVLDSAECKLQVCPREAQEEAWKTCTLVRDASFDDCSKVVDREKFVSSCLESSCACLSSGNSTSQECRCKILTSFVSECMAGDKNVDLSTWRSIHDCPAMCDAPFVHKDCFRNKCEMSCANLREIDPCPVMDGLCVPGCFCPDGTVRNGDTCVPPSECRDCVCDGLGNSKFVTFDKSDILFDGNCTYVLSKSILSDTDDKALYEIYVSNGACAEGICTEALTILYKSHVVQIIRGDQPHELISIVDEQQINKFPYKNDWLILEETPNRDINLLIPTIQLELVGFKHNFAFMLRLPSHTFAGEIEGLCGDCNGRQENDLKMSSGELSDNVQEFGNSWLVRNLPSALNLNNEHCASKPKKKCVDSPWVNEFCGSLLADGAFARCHGLVDPVPYYLACKDTLCNNGNGCDNLEAYARTCSFAGICVNWRMENLCPYKCPRHLEYRACNTGCPETCETLNKEIPEKCTASSIEGCFCPPDQAMHNETCIPKRNCFVCDDEGHVDGDVWQPDKCTQCTCRKKLVKCQETNCPARATICEENANPVLVPGTENDCCPKYVCVPATTIAPICIETQQPECGYAQTLKITVDANGCQKFICQCVPEEECPLLEIESELKNEILEPGYVKVTNTSGCCPRISKICKPETCPQIPKCQKFYDPVVKSSPDSCCTKVECEPPKDICIYHPDSSNELNFMDSVIAKKIGVIWEDGNCKTCICEFKDGVPTSRCTTKDCLNQNDHPDVNDYVLEEIRLDTQCCPNFKRVACKHDGIVYKVGEKWYPNRNDTCVIAKCSIDGKGVTKKTIIQECSELCETGYMYRKPLDKSNSCCGECEAFACVIDGQLREIGETWYSEDYCVTSHCIRANGSLHVQIERETCETIDPIEAINYKIEKQIDYGKCCPNIVRTACLNDEKYYEPGETWINSFDGCIVESCVKTAEGKIVKEKETKTCNTDCPKGWKYQQPELGICCGECKQSYCIIDDYLYEPGKTWYSDDNCTSYSCIQNSDQLLISSSPTICPEINCAPELKYNDGCCMKCNITKENKIDEQPCTVEMLDYEKTIGLIQEEKGSHGICKNWEPIKSMGECHGNCHSSTYFDTTTWEQVVDCKCCQPLDYKNIVVELECDDGQKFKKTITVPSKCTCSNCSSNIKESHNISNPFTAIKSYMKKYHKKSKD